MSNTLSPTCSPTIDWRDLHSGYQQTPGQIYTSEPNTITCLAGGEEMLRVSPNGFWVRGVRVAQDDNEAETVYNAFKAWMTWAQLDKDYK